MNLDRIESNIRSDELDEIAKIDILNKEKIRTGFSQYSNKIYNDTKNKILKELNATDEDWQNPQWQLKNRITSVQQISKYINLNELECKNIEKVSSKYRFAVTPYYFSLIDFENIKCPIKLQCIPNIEELEDFGTPDPMNEKKTNPAGKVTRRYPNKLIINVTNICASFCRHCQRRRLIGECDKISSSEYIEESIEYIKNHPTIREVLITGGDALLLSNDQLENIFIKLSEIKHVEVLRIGTRVLATLPFRVDLELAELLRKYKVNVVTQFNHACEITKEAVKAIDTLVDHGVIVRNQMVLLRDVNDDKYCIQKTNEELEKYRVIPYYLFHPKSVIGTKHFQVSISKGLKIMKHLEGRTSGMCKPTYIYNSPNGYGKVPLLPIQNIKEKDNYFELVTWENKIIKVEEQEG